MESGVMPSGVVSPNVGSTKTLVPEEHAKDEHGKVSTSYTIFLIVVLIVMLFVTGVFIANAVYYDRIRKAGGCSTAISKNESDILFWVNVILAVISGIMVIVAIVLLFFAYKKPEYTEKYIGRYQLGSSVQPYAQKAKGVARGVGGAVPGAVAGARLGYAEGKRAGYRHGRSLGYVDAVTPPPATGVDFVDAPPLARRRIIPPTTTGVDAPPPLRRTRFDVRPRRYISEVSPSSTFVSPRTTL